MTKKLQGVKSKTQGVASNYTGVSLLRTRAGVACSIRYQAQFPWSANISVAGKIKKKWFATEREAAIQYDKWVLEAGLDRPLNILKKKE